MWNRIIGHKRQIEQLKETIQKKRIPNAYLFHGPHGIGKYLVAKTFAVAAACEDKNIAKRIFDGVHPDVIHVRPTGDKVFSISIAQIRGLNQSLRLHPLELSKKIAIIDESNMMTESAANSLLKLLEEPPQDTHLILISSEPGAILPTIRSRCQKVSFSPLSENDIKEALITVGRSPDEASLLSKMADGSLGLAIALSPDTIDEVVERFSSLSSKPSAADILEVAENWSQLEKPDAVCDILMHWYRSNIDRIGLETSLSKMEEIINARFMLTTAANKQLLFESLLFSLTSK